MGRKVLTPGIPAWLFGAIAGLDQRARGNGAKLTKDRARYMVHPDWVSAPALQVPAERWRPSVDTAEGLRATAAWYRSENWL